MDLELTTRDVALNDKVREYVERKIGRLDRYLPDLRTVRVELRHGSKRSMGEVHTVQVTAWAGRTVLRAEERNQDLYAAIDLAADKLQRQAERYKGKRDDRRHGQGQVSPAELAALLSAPDGAGSDEDEGADAPRIVRRKQFELYAMSEDEAVDQLELLGHDFFVYRDGDSGQVNVLYRRKDGGLGLIEPLEA